MTPEQKKAFEPLLKELQLATDGMTALEKALMFAEILRECDGAKWKIKANDDNSFSVIRTDGVST